MCGIAGFTGPPDPLLLDRMVATLRHRGPDDAGVWNGRLASLGMRRLAIVDLTSGQQPYFNETRTIAVVFNGEIYNHRALRSTLEGRGHRFRSHHADGEVLVHLYEEHGPAFLDHLVGMFAIALWDESRQRLLLARDHTGIKPLYHAPLADGHHLFGSEPRALLVHPAISRDPDPVALHHYFTFKNVPAPHSAFAAIRQLGPGERLLHEGGEWRVERWWNPPREEEAGLEEGEAARRLRHLLEESVALQMEMDVPYAAYLSGGVDSSAVVALMSQRGAGRIKTFTLVYDEEFPGKSADREYARQVARRYGTEHHEELVTFDQVPRTLDAVVEAFQEPFSGVISTFFLTEAIGRHVKVAISGDGADELFGSYLPHRLAQPLRFLEERGAERETMTPEAWRVSLAPFAEREEYLRGVLARGDETARRMGQYLAGEAEKRALYTPAMAEAVGGVTSEALVAGLLARAGTSDPLNRILHLDQRTLLPDHVLAFVDRLSMAHSVEVRPPFLDHRLVEFAARLPGRMKIKGGRVKHILKEAVADLLPEGVVDRPKEGFLMPINSWLLGRWEGWVRAVLAPGRLASHGLLEPTAVGGVLEAHYAGAADHGNRLWNLVMFQLWWERYGTGGGE